MATFNSLVNARGLRVGNRLNRRRPARGVHAASTPAMTAALIFSEPPGTRVLKRRERRAPFAVLAALAACLFYFVGQLSIIAGETNLATWRQNEFSRTQKIFLADTNQATNAWQFAGACYDCADNATNETVRADFARQGIAASKAAVARAAKSAAAHYYLAMNYGELAQAEAPSLAAYKLVHEVEQEFKTAAELDATFDYAGPVRNLGALYFQAPAWPLSVGSKKRAREKFLRAAALAPDYPENQLNLAEAFTRWRERAEAEKSFHALEKVWPGVATNFPGLGWQGLRDEWSRRRDETRAAFKKAYKAEP